MKKKLLLPICVLSFLATVFFGIRLAAGLTALLEQAGASGGIIGGADAPTAIFWLTYILPRTPIFWGAICSLAVFLTSGIAAIVPHKHK